MNELIIPPAVQNDPQAFEILRIWAAHNEQHVTIHSNLKGEAYDFGTMLAELARHASILYAERFNISTEDSLSKIIAGFKDEIDDPAADVSGEIMK